MQKETVPHYMLDHFEEDRKTFKRYDELLSISGEHMSHIRKDLTEVKDMLIRSNEILALHMKRVEPMLLSYEKDIIIKESYNHVGDSVVKWSVRVGAVSALGGTFYWLIKTIKNL